MRNDPACRACIPKDAPMLDPAWLPLRAHWLLHSVRDPAYCIPIRASAYINKQLWADIARNFIGVATSDANES